MVNNIKKDRIVMIWNSNCPCKCYDCGFEFYEPTGGGACPRCGGAWKENTGEYF